MADFKSKRDRQKLRDNKEDRLESEQVNLEDLNHRIRAVKLEVLSIYENKWKNIVTDKGKISLTKVVSLNDQLAAMDKFFYDAGYMSLPLQRAYTEQQKYDHIRFYTVNHYPVSLYGKGLGQFDGEEDPLRVLLVKIYLLRYPQAYLSQYWLKFYCQVKREKHKVQKQSTMVEGESYWSRAKNLALRCRQTAAEGMEMVTSTVRAMWNTVSNVLSKFVAGKLLRLIVAIVVGGLILKFMGFWLATTVFPCLLQGKSVSTAIEQDVVKQGTESNNPVGMVGKVIATVIDPVLNFDIEAFVNKFGRLTSSINSISKFLNNVWGYLVPMMDHIYAGFNNGIPYTSEGQLKREIDIQKQLIDAAVPRMATSPDSCGIILEAHKTITDRITYEIRQAYPSVSKAYMDYMLNYKKHVTTAEQKMKMACSRLEPVWINFVGDAGIGKTFLTNAVVKDLYKLIYSEYPESVEANIYSKADPKFYPLYDGQFCMVFDDLLQQGDVRDRMEQACELIHMCNSAPMPLPQADVDSKGTVHFKSLVILSTMNYSKRPLSYYPSNLGITDPNALMRRMSLNLFVTRDTNVEGTAAYTFKSILSNVTTGQAMTYAEMLTLANAKHLERQEDKLSRERMQKNSVNDVADIGKMSENRYNELMDETEFIKQPRKTDAKAVLSHTRVVARAVDKQSGFGEDMDLHYESSCSDDEDNKPSKPDKSIIAEVFNEAKNKSKTILGAEKVKSYNERMEEPIDWAEEEGDTPGEDMLNRLSETYTRMGDLVFQKSAEIRKQAMQSPLLKHWAIRWQVLSEKEGLQADMAKIKQWMNLIMQGSEIDKERDMIFVLKTTGLPWMVDVKYREFLNNPVLYAQRYPKAEGARDVYMRHHDAVGFLVPAKTFMYNGCLDRKSIEEMYTMFSDNRDLTAREFFEQYPTYNNLFCTERNKFAAMVGEMCVMIAVGKLVRIGKNTLVNQIVQLLDLRILVFRKNMITTARMWIANRNCELSLLASPHYLDASILRFTSALRHIPLLTHNTMTEIMRKDKSMAEKITTYFSAKATYSFEQVDEFPTSCIPPKELIDQGLLLFEDSVMKAKRLRAENYDQWFRLMGGLAIATTIIVACITVAKAIMRSYGHKESIIHQSFDPKTERKAKKGAIRLAKRARKVPTKATIRTEGVVKQSGKISIVPKVIRNTELMLFHGDREQQAYAFFITPYTFATVSHVFTQDNIKKIEFCFPQTEGGGSITVHRGDYDVKLHIDRELAIVTIKPGMVPAHQTLIRHIPPRSEHLREIPDVVLVEHEVTGHFILRAAGMAAVTTAKFAVGGQAKNVYRVPLITEEGDCGLPYMSLNDHDNYPIKGVHMGFNGTHAYFTPLYKEDFEVSVQEPMEVQSLLADGVRLTRDKEVIIPGLKFIGNLRKDDGTPRVSYGSVSDPYQPTGLKLDKPTKVPVKIKKTIDSEGTVHVPFVNAIKQYSMESRDVDYSTNYIKMEDFKGLGPVDFGDYQPLTEHEVVNGTIFPEMGPMDLTTSPGPGFEGEDLHDMFPGEDGNRRYSDKVRKMVDRHEEYLQHDLPLPSIGVGALKMELKTQEKQYVPRIYNNMTKPNMCTLKKYVGPVMRKIMLTGKSDLAIGINPFGMDWRDLHMQAAGYTKTKIVADDVKKWDIHMRIWPIIFMFRNWLIMCRMEEKYANIISNIILGTLTPYIIFGDCMYQGIMMPSGTFITAWFNSVYNSVTTRAMFRIANPQLLFDEHVFLRVMGDDNFMAISDDLDDDLWNGQVYAKLRKQYMGIITTSIFKDGRDVPKFMPLECSTGEEDGVALFLKRRFRVDKGLVFPALELETIEGIMTWCKPTGGRTLQSAVEEQFSTALRELVYYPEEVFNKYESKMREFCATRGYIMPYVDRKAHILQYFKS